MISSDKKGMFAAYRNAILSILSLRKQEAIYEAIQIVVEVQVEVRREHALLISTEASWPVNFLLFFFLSL